LAAKNDDGKLGVVVILAHDWTMFAEQMRLSDIEDADILEVMVAGFVVREDEEYICVAQQVFNEDIPNVRFTVMIPKHCIIERQDLKMNRKSD